MGLLDKYLNNESNLDNPTPVVNIGATNQSKLHADGDKPGYSMGNPLVANQVIAALNAYDDGVVNLAPAPSILDLTYNSPANAPQYNYTHTYLPEYKYLDNLPE
jgi:hypothetical protein